MSPRVKLSAVVLRTVDYGESDRVVSLFSKERGKLSTFARGARASRRRFGGALEPFTLVVAEIAERPGRDLATLVSVSVARGFGAIRAELARIACAGYACDLARALIRDGEPHPDLFALLVGYLARLDAAPASSSELRAFELGALQEAGLRPRLDACVRCGRPAPMQPAAAARVRFDPAQGGLVCSRCVASAGALEVNLATTLALARLQETGVVSVEAEPLAGPSSAPTLDLASGAEARDLVSAFIEHQIGRRLASRKFLDEVGPTLAELSPGDVRRHPKCPNSL